MDKVRYAIIGCGGIAHMFHLPEMTEIPQTEFVVACDLRENRARLTAEKFGAREWATDYRTVLERDDVDAVIVATYHPTHAPIACEALEAGKHVLVLLLFSKEGGDQTADCGMPNPKAGRAWQNPLLERDDPAGAQEMFF